MSSGSPEAPSVLRAPRVLTAVGVALALRGGLLWLVPDPTPVNDEVDYWRLAEGLASGEGFLSTFRPPLHPGFLALFVGMGEGAVAARATQALIGALSVLPMAWLGQRIAGERGALVAAWGMALDPVLIGFAHLLWSETLYIALLLGGVVALVRDAEGPRPTHYALAGVCFGLAGLARPQLLSFLPLLLPWVAWRVRGEPGAQRRRAALAFVALTLATCAVVLPWSLRNLARTGDFFLVDTNGPYNLLVSTEPGAQHVDKDDRWDPSWAAIGNTHYMFVSDRDPGLAQSIALRRASERIAEAPLRFASKSAWEALHLATLDNFIVRHLRNEWYGGSAPAGVIVGVTLASALFTALLYLTGAVGLIAAPASPLRGLALLALGHALLLFAITYSLSRYAVPLRPFLLLGVASLVASGTAWRDRLRASPARSVACALVAVGLLLSWARDLPLLADMLSTGGAGHRFERSIGR